MRTNFYKIVRLVNLAKIHVKRLRSGVGTREDYIQYNSIICDLYILLYEEGANVLVYGIKKKITLPMSIPTLERQIGYYKEKSKTPP